MKQNATWTWDRIHKEQAHMSDSELDKALGSMREQWPEDIKQIVKKLDNKEDLTESEDLRLEQWESSPGSGIAGSIMGGIKR